MELNIDPKVEEERIVTFLKNIFETTKKSGIVVGVSGGIDSSLAISLVAKSIGPDRTYALNMPYGELNMTGVLMARKIIERLNIPFENTSTIDITEIVGSIANAAGLSVGESSIRLGNVMARSRMILLYDYAKKNNLIVCGTENKSEHMLGYYTRFGDEASDVEPLRSLYKTQVYQLAEFVGIPSEIVLQNPTAGLWNGQTDEGEFGFSYKEADQVLCLFYEKKASLNKILKSGYANAQKILDWVKKNKYKNEVPYMLENK